MKVIVTLVDFSDVTPKLIEQSEKFAHAFSARVILLHLAPQEPVIVDADIVSPVVSQPPSPQVKKEDYERLSSLGDLLTKAGVDVSLEQLTEGDGAVLIQECRQWNADLIIVGSHHHGRIYNLVVGSITSDLLREANCPVLVVPADNS